MDQQTNIRHDAGSHGQPLIAPGYMSGFGNSFETEALPGALPIGRNGRIHAISGSGPVSSEPAFKPLFWVKKRRD